MKYTALYTGMVYVHACKCKFKQRGHIHYDRRGSVMLTNYEPHIKINDAISQVCVEMCDFSYVTGVTNISGKISADLHNNYFGMLTYMDHTSHWLYHDSLHWLLVGLESMVSVLFCFLSPPLKGAHFFQLRCSLPLGTDCVK